MKINISAANYANAANPLEHRDSRGGSLDLKPQRTPRAAEEMEPQMNADKEFFGGGLHLNHQS
jgi:hypothetical protein